MTRLFKLTDNKNQTMHNCSWGIGVTVETSGEGKLCGDGFTHWYTSPLLAVLLDPIHGAYLNANTPAHLWEGEGEVIKSDHGLKVGCKKATVLRRIKIPEINKEHRVRFAIACVWQVYDDKKWRVWSQSWIDGKDRTVKAAVSYYCTVGDPIHVACINATCLYCDAATDIITVDLVYACAADDVAYAAEAADLDLIALAEWAVTESTEIPEGKINV